METEKPIVELHNVSKVFRLPHEHRDTLKEHFFGFHKKVTSEDLWALKDVTASIQKGEFVSFIGPNGGGKTTLLRIISQVYAPTQGDVRIHGSISPFVDLVVGFSPDLTARDNIYLYGAVLGLKPRIMQERFLDIIQFGNLEKFVDQTVKNFSSGMQARLAFSIAAHADADILLVDEVLAVGDQEFKEKCFELFRQFKSQRKTIIFVSHDLNVVQHFSDRVGLIKNGSLEMLGEPQATISAYQRSLTSA